MRRWSGDVRKCRHCHTRFEALPWQTDECDYCALPESLRDAYVRNTPVAALQRPTAPRWAWCSIDRRFEPYGTSKHRTRRHA